MPDAVVAAGIISFGVGIAIGAAWGHGGYGYGWGGNNINVNVNNSFNRNANINRGGNSNWSHNPQHRGGAPYSNRTTANKYGGTTRGGGAGVGTQSAGGLSIRRVRPVRGPERQPVSVQPEQRWRRSRRRWPPAAQSVTRIRRSSRVARTSLMAF